MFEGVPDQFHQFLASRTSLPLPLSSPPSLNGTSSASATAFSNFDPYTCHPLQPNFLHPLHQTSQPTSKNEDKHDNTMVAVNLDQIQTERSLPESIDPWTNDEVLTLLRIRSSMEHWFPEFTWDHISRKLADVGFKRSAEKCKEKFEEDSRYFNNINFSKNYRVFGEFEDLYHDDNNNSNNQNPQKIIAEKDKKMDKATQEEDKIEEQHVEQDISRNDQTAVLVGNPTEDNEKEVEKSKTKKRKREKKFEMFKGFCEDIISRIMAQQEEMHNKLLEDMVKRDEEKLAREEAWKKLELDRIDKELQLRAHEQALAGDRQATIINFLKNFSSSTVYCTEIIGEKSSKSSSSSSLLPPQNPNSTSQTNNLTNLESSTSSTITASGHHRDSNFLTPKDKNPFVPTSMPGNQPTQNPNSSSTLISRAQQNPNNFLNSQSNPSVPSSLSADTVYKKHTTPNEKDDLGKRWPNDEVLALINLRCSLYNSNEHRESVTVKAPLWGKISKGMSDMGYNRSAKRCKEKWENINKYFRKTKDVNKKRSVDSRTCPYFHQLSTLYNQGKFVPSLDQPEKQPVSPENRSANRISSDSNSTMQVAEDEKKSGSSFRF